MPPAKRARPFFSPPRPGKSTSKSKPATTTTSASEAGSKKRSRAVTTASSTKSKPKPAAARKRKRTPSPHNSSSAPSSPATSTNDDTANDESPTTSSPASPPADTDDAYAAADGLLVEITNEDAPPPTIPLGLIHRIMLEHWGEEDEHENGDTGEKTTTTKLSGDAREVLGAYVDTFVREAVARAAFEAGEREKKGGAGDGAGGGGGKGWLDVEDLERVGGGLVLDF